MPKHGTANVSQFMKVLNPLGIAAATALKSFSISEIISVLNSKGEKLTDCLRLVFASLLNNQILTIQDRPRTIFLMLLGQYKSVLGLRRALDKSGLRVAPWVIAMIKSKSFSILKKPVTMEFVIITGKELGFETHFGIDQLYDRAAKRGLMLCPSEFGIQLYLTPVHDVANQEFLVAMEPIEIETYEKDRNHEAQLGKCVFGFSGNFMLYAKDRVDSTGFSISTSFIFLSGY